MARPIYNHELLDPDFSWLLTTYKENHPEFVSLECVGMPIVLFKLTDHEFHRSMLPMLGSEDSKEEIEDIKK